MDLSQIAKESETAKNVFEAFNARERFRRETDLKRLERTLLEQGKKVVSEELVAVFKGLQDLGIGTLVIGRGNRYTRFKWHYSLRDVAKAAVTAKKLNKKDKIGPREPIRAKVESAPAGPVYLTLEQLEAVMDRLMAKRGGK